MTKADLKTLLNGTGRGLPLFLAWVLGTAVTAVAVHCFILTTPGLTESLIQRLAAVDLFFLSYQALLLLPSFWRRLGWVVIGFTCFRLPYFRGVGDFCFSFWTHPLFLAVVLQSTLLLGVRRRGWLLAVVAITIYPVWRILTPSFDSAYQWATSLLPGGFWMSATTANAMLLLQLFGLVLAFLIPPVDSKKSP